jgi:hypothetical protein
MKLEAQVELSNSQRLWIMRLADNETQLQKQSALKLAGRNETQILQMQCSNIC